LPPEQLQELHDILLASPLVEQVVAIQAVYTGPEEVIVAAKVHPTNAASIEDLAKAMDDLDLQLRKASPFVADVYLDVTLVSIEPGEKRS
jgi:divalent metal cation (Fe/Co/Zn/Cd) transporter